MEGIHIHMHSQTHMYSGVYDGQHQLGSSEQRSALFDALKDTVMTISSTTASVKIDPGQMTEDHLGHLLYRHLRLLELQQAVVKGAARAALCPYANIARRPSQTHVFVRSESFKDEAFARSVPAHLRSLLGDATIATYQHSSEHAHLVKPQDLPIAQHMLDVEWRHDCGVCSRVARTVAAAEAVQLRRELADPLGPFWESTTKYEQKFQSMASTMDGVVYVRVRGVRLLLSNTAQYAAAAAAGMLVCRVRVGTKEISWVLQPHQVETDQNLPVDTELQPLTSYDAGSGAPIRIAEWLGLVLQDGRLCAVTGLGNRSRLECNLNLRTGIDLQLVLVDSQNEMGQGVEQCLLSTELDLTQVGGLCNQQSQGGCAYAAAWVHDGINFEVSHRCLICLHSLVTCRLDRTLIL